MTKVSVEAMIVPIGDVKPYPENTKLHSKLQIRRIANSITRYGWDQAIVVDAEMVIIKGHGRLEAAKQIGLTEVPIVVNDQLSEEEVKLSRIMDNKSAESEWNLDNLWGELTSVKKGGIEIQDVGFDEKAIGRLFPKQMREQKERSSEKKHKKEAPPESKGADSDGFAIDPTVPLEEGFVDYHKGGDAWMRKLSMVDYFNLHDKIVVAFSGGKDSLCGLVWVLENCDADKLFTYYANLGWGCDWPHSMEYVRIIEAKYNIKVHFAGPSDPACLGGFEENLLQIGYPGYGAVCWVESMVKVPRANALLKQEGLLGKESGLKVVQLFGIRWSESPSRARIYPDRGVWTENGNHYASPIIQWSEADVAHFLDERGILLHSAYEGAARMGCLMCPKSSAQGMITIRKKFPKHWRKVLEFYALGSRRSDKRKERDIPAHFSRWLLSAENKEKVNQEKFGSPFGELAMSTKDLEDELERVTGEDLPRPYLTENFNVVIHKQPDDLKGIVFRAGRSEAGEYPECAVDDDLGL